MTDSIDPYLASQALAVINAKRRAAGLPERTGFGQYVPAVEPDQQAELQAGQAQLLKRRDESGIAAEPQPDPSPSLQEILANLQPPAPSRRVPVCQTVKIWSRLTLAASRSKLGGAARAWIFAQSLDPAGSGVVAQTDLRALLEQITGSRSSSYRWISEAVQAGFLAPARGGSRYLIRSTQAVCQRTGISDPGQRVEVSAAGLGKAGWKGLLWAANLAGHTRPVSRAYLERSTGVPARTQKEYDREGHITVRSNFAVDLNSQSEQLDGYQDFKKSHAFVVRCGGVDRIAYRLPNSYTTPNTVKQAGGAYRALTIRLRLSTAVSVCSENEAVYDRSISRGREGAFSAGGPSQTTAPRRSHRRYFNKSSDVRKVVNFYNRKGFELEKTDRYILLPGGIARHARAYAHNTWWMLDNV